MLKQESEALLSLEVPSFENKWWKNYDCWWTLWIKLAETLELICGWPSLSRCVAGHMQYTQRIHLQGSKNQTRNSRGYQEENTAGRKHCTATLRKRVASWYMSKVSRAQPVSQIRDTAVAPLENSYSESPEKLLLHCLSCLLGAVRFWLLCMGLPNALLSCDLLARPPRLSMCQGLLLQDANPYRYSYSLTYRVLSLPDHSTFSTADRKIQVFAGGNSQCLSLCLKHGRWSLSLWTMAGVCGDPTAQPAITLGDIPLLLSPC